MHGNTSLLPYIFILIYLFFAAQLCTFVWAMCNQILYHFELNNLSRLALWMNKTEDL